MPSSHPSLGLSVFFLSFFRVGDGLHPAAAASGVLLAAMAKNSSRHTPRAYALSRRDIKAVTFCREATVIADTTTELFSPLSQLSYAITISLGIFAFRPVSCGDSYE